MPILSSFLWFKKNGDPWDTIQLSDFMAKETIAILGSSSKLTVASYRHIVIAISRESIPKGSYFDRDLGQEVQETLNMQGGHSSETAQGTYGRVTTQGSGGLISDREKHEQITRAWWKWFQERNTHGVSDPQDHFIGIIIPSMS